MAKFIELTEIVRDVVLGVEMMQSKMLVNTDFIERVRKDEDEDFTRVMFRNSEISVTESYRKIKKLIMDSNNDQIQQQEDND